LIFEDKIKFGEGLGYDGQTYGRLVKEFPRNILQGSIDTYYCQRMLPVALAKVTLVLLGKTSALNSNIILIFQTFNFLAIMFSIYLWYAISNACGYCKENAWLGYFALFYSFALYKMPLYYPVLTDVFAFTLSLLMLYSYILENPLILFIAIILSAFTWPTMIFFGGTLFIFADKRHSWFPEIKDQKKQYFFTIGCSCMVVVITILWALYAVYEDKALTMFAEVPIYKKALPFSITFVCIYMFFASLGLIKAINITNIRVPFSVLIKNIRFSHLIVWSLFFITTRLILRLLAPYGPPPLIARIMGMALKYPGVYTISQFVYFGPVILLVYLLWHRIAPRITDFGFGFWAFAMLLLPLSLFSEGRLIINGIPFIVIMLLNGYDFSNNKKLLYFCIFLTILCSRFWINLNTYHTEHYFASSGPWLQPRYYLIQATITGVAAGIMFILLFQEKYWMKAKVKN